MRYRNPADTPKRVLEPVRRWLEHYELGVSIARSHVHPASLTQIKEVETPNWDGNQLEPTLTTQSQGSTSVLPMDTARQAKCQAVQTDISTPRAAVLSARAEQYRHCNKTLASGSWNSEHCKRDKPHRRERKHQNSVCCARVRRHRHSKSEHNTLELLLSKLKKLSRKVTYLESQVRHKDNETVSKEYLKQRRESGSCTSSQ